MIGMTNDRHGGAQHNGKKPKKNDGKPEGLGKPREDWPGEDEENQAGRDADAEEPFLTYGTPHAGSAKCGAVSHRNYCRPRNTVASRPRSLPFSSPPSPARANRAVRFGGGRE